MDYTPVNEPLTTARFAGLYGEAHLGDSVDEQKRWLGEVWQQAQEARQAGADVQAVTVWALLGLQIVRRLCELLGASLEIESIKGRGTLFRIRLPIRYSTKH